VNRGRSFLLLLALAAGVGAYVWFVEMKRDPDAAEGPAREKLFAVEASQIQELRLTAETGEPSTLKRNGDRWLLSEIPGAEVDESEANGIVTSLAGLEATRVVDEQPASLAEYGLDKPRMTVAFTDPAGKQQTVHIGSRTPTGGDLYAKLADSPRVILIGSWLEETFNRSRSDLRDKSVMKFARDAVGAITITNPSGTFVLTRVNGVWRITTPIDAEADDAGVESLISRLASARAQTIVDAPAAASTGLSKPVASVAVTAGPTRSTLEIGAAAGEGSVYARDAARNLVFTVESSLADELKKKPDDFRKKEQ
jgi:hypothetical protein